jgi:predicted lipid-binding transport protein (Tim44 family)
MLLVELGQAMWVHATHATDVLAVAAHKLAPNPPANPSEIDTNKVISFLGTKIAPILLGVLGVIFIGRASKGEVSKVITSSAIAIIGMVFIAGALSLFFLGDYLLSQVLK